MTADNHPTDPTTPAGGAALNPPCVSCDDTATRWRFDGQCHDCFVSNRCGRVEAPPCRNCSTRYGAWKTGEPAPSRTQGFCNACYLRLRAHGNLGNLPEPPSLTAHRKAQARLEAMMRRIQRHEATRHAGQAAAFARANPERVTPEALRALFVGPVVEEGCAYWASNGDQAA